MPKYTSIQFAPDGDFILDYEADTVEEVEQLCADQGSRWYFYPYQFVICKPELHENILKKRIRSASHPFEYCDRKSVETAQREIIATDYNGGF